MHGLARSFQCVDERLLGEFLNDRFNGPSQAKGHVARERDGSAFDHYAGIPLLQSPIGIQAPQESVTSVGLRNSLLQGSGTFHFCYARCAREAHPTRWVHGAIMHLMIGIEDNGNDLLFQKAK